ncbi:PREDICTED: ATP-dependent DNA helicase 2 subunit KU80 [Fragaria vesca subsp. vesca]|uniref:ATP-dependent DNA helicase 2 subunit KU80 n=1 Tax=Fragaria vesca subsp. vesca TaxID=101020 RepID=UPI0002C372FA|nr:PREDICTED: ATP-dependent DNA helicase 2 subunit KU80 [Fragaria vesca subsp. vesca]
MSRGKDGTVLVIDVGPSMHKALPEIERLCSMLVEKKLIYSKSDEVGVVLFGTEGTENVLTREVGGYDHITVLQDIKVVDEDLIQAVEQLPRGTHNGDFLDAVIVGMDMLIKKYGETNKGKKRLCLFTNAHYPTKAPLEGSKEDQVIAIAGHMNTQGMRLESIVIRGGLTGEAKKSIMDENDHLLDIFSKRTCAKLVHVETPTSLLGALRTRKVSPVTIFRGDLELTPKMKIKVWVYKKTSEDKFPTLKKYSDRAAPTDKYATHEVKVEFEYKSAEDLSKVVPPEQRIKGYRYGPQVIPISSAEWDAVKFKPEKSVKLLGFSDAQNILRHYYMKDVNIFIPEPGNTKAIIAVSALARAMKDMNKVAIVRCVWRQGQASVVVGALIPNVSDNDNIPDSFYFNVLPFTEDIREFQFPSFNNFPAAWQPNEQQQEAADDFVRMFDLAPPGKQEILPPDLTPNPVLERFFRHLELKSRDPDTAVPPIDETLRKISEPDKELIAANKSVIDAFRSRFEVKENPKLKKSSRRLLKEKPSASDEREDHMDISDQPNSNEHTSGIKVTTIGDSAPVQDFEAMMSRRDSPEWVGKAIKDMKNKIHDLVEDSHEGDNYPKALECLIALRKGCILEQEPNKFNDFLRSLCKFCQDKYLSSFCEFLATKELTLIPKTEAIDSEVTDAEARSFLVKSEPKLE